MSDRRDFLRQLTLTTAAVGGGAILSPLGAEELERVTDSVSESSAAWAFNDDIWSRYAIGEERKVNDPVTKQPAHRNPYAKAMPGEPDWAAASKLDALHARGAVFLVCNRASMNWAAGAAQQTGRDVEQVRAEVRSNLLPGATLMPTGVFALVRAQNAGCAYMKGS